MDAAVDPTDAPDLLVSAANDGRLDDDTFATVH